MALTIRWSTRADIKLDQLIIYLETEWGENVVKAFIPMCVNHFASGRGYKHKLTDFRYIH